MVLLCLLAPAVAASALQNMERRPLLRALRGGSRDGELMWVKSPAGDGDSTMHLVRSLATFCEEYGLDEEAMMAVSKGDADEHEGWTCGALKEHESAAAGDAADEDEDDEDSTAVVEDVPVTTKKKKRKAAMVAEEEEEEEDTSTAAKPAPPAPQMGKTIVGMVAPMVVLRVLKRFDQTSEQYLQGLRMAFFGIIALNTFIQILLGMRIKMTKDKTLVKKPLNPLAMLMGGGKDGGDQAAWEYDLKQLKSLQTSYRIGALFTCFLHFKMKMHQPLVYSCCSGVIDLYYHPLVKIHLLGAKAEGALKRPFGAADPNAANPFAALMKPPPGAQAAPQASPDSLKNDTD